MKRAPDVKVDTSIVRHVALGNTNKINGIVISSLC